MASSDRERLWDMDISSYLSHKEKDWETRSHIVSQGEGLWEKVSLQGAHGLHEKDLRVIVWSQSLKGREKKEEQRVEWGSALSSWPFKRFFPTVQCSEISRTFHYKCSSFSGAFHSWWAVPGTGTVYLAQPWLEQNLIERPNAVSLVFTFGVNWSLIPIGRGFETFNWEDRCSIDRFTSLFEAILDRSSSRYWKVSKTEI